MSNRIEYEKYRYSVSLLDDDGDEEVLAREDRRDVAFTLFELMQAQNPGHTIILRDEGREVERGALVSG